MKTNFWVINKKIEGVPKCEDFTCVEEDVPACKDGDIIIKAEFLTVDPYMRYRIKTMDVGELMPGGQVARVIESCCDKYPVDSYVICYAGWRTVTHLTAEARAKADMVMQKVPDMKPLSRSLALGILGMPGNTAYFGFLELCQPKEGETVLVNGAAGAVGSAVCQIAKIKGCKVIAFAGTDAKVAWLKKLGADHVFNYKTDDVSKSLKKVAPEGINCYFDNVGGDFSAAVVPHLAQFARVSICGCISSYNDTEEESAKRISPYLERVLLWKQLRVEGFIVTRWLGSKWMEAINQMSQWLKEGKLQYKETVTEGFENMPAAFNGLFHGENTGKAIIKA